MKVIENYKRAVENSDTSSFKKVFAPQVWVETPAGPSVNHPANTASLILSEVAKTAPGIRCTLTADAGNNWIRYTSTQMAKLMNLLSTCVRFRWPRGLRKSSLRDFSLPGRKHSAIERPQKTTRQRNLLGPPTCLAYLRQFN